jgi:carbamoyltransferase
MITLGINAAFHDSSAALVADGQVVAAAEEERFTRIKHGKRPLPFTAWELPFHAMDYCLQEAGLTMEDVDHVAYSYDPQEFLGDRVHVSDEEEISLPLQPSARRAVRSNGNGNGNGHVTADAGPRPPELHGKGDWENPWDPLFAAYVVNAPRQLRDGAPHHLQRRFATARRDPRYRWHFVGHHTSHQASAFLASPFERCAVMTLDGRGEQATTSYGVYRDNRYRQLGQVCMPHSLGLLYERITSHLGFLHSSDEYKVMALAALGTPRFGERLRDQLCIDRDGHYRIAPFDPTEMFGPPRERGAALEQHHLDLAASLQEVLEDSVLRLAQWLRQVSGENNLAMAGGVALNCVMNSRLRDRRLFDAVWVQPAAGDAGTALGAALWIDARERHEAAAPKQLQAASSAAPDDGAHATVDEAGIPLAPRRWRMDHAYWGPAYGDAEIEAMLRWAKLPYRRPDDLADTVAGLLADNRIVGWFQGRMEFGPRALGARSILASPIDPQMQARLNELKDREDFRPVAPALPEEDLPNWFWPEQANDGHSPFMLFIYNLQPKQDERIPSACHSDRTARVQTVTAAANPRFHALLKAFGRRTGVPVLVNTSFNVRGEPIVCTPRDAIEAFWSTPLDALAIGPFLVEKPAA